jgi:hypothetical protein
VVAKEIRLILALLVASVLDMVRKAGRLFFKYSRTFDPQLAVNSEDVAEYENNMQTQVFDRIRASFLNSPGRIGALGKSLGKIPSKSER